MKKKIRQSDIARIAKVSQATVSIVLDGKNGGRRVSQATRERIEKIATEMGYQPDIVARQLRGSRSGLIGVLIGLSAAPVILERLFALEQAALLRGYRTLAGSFGKEIEHASHYINDFIARGVEGVVCLSHEHREQPQLLARLISRIPNVVYLRQPSLPGAHYIHVDAADCIHQGIEHLVQRGRKRIGIILLDNFHQANRHRRDGYMEAIARNNLPYDENLIWVGDDSLHPNPHEVSNAKAAEVVEVLVKKSKADAIIAINDDWAAQLIKAIRNIGLQVPRDISIIGQGNFKIASFFDPEITTLDPQNKLFAEAAIDLLDEMIEKGQNAVRKTITIKPRLIIRAST